VIASCEYEDLQTKRDCIDNAGIIEKYAQEAQLWPHEETIGEYQVLRDVKLYVTYGSFTVKTTSAKDIITSEQTFRDAGEGTGVIILMPRNPTDQVLGLHIKSDKPQPGMNAYNLELLTAVVGLYLTKYVPSAVKGYSDCMGAIIRLNEAILAFHNTQSSVTAGVLISSGYQCWAAEDDTRDIAMIKSEKGDPRLIPWIRSHPEKDERAQNPDKMAKGIFMADAVVTFEHETVMTLGSARIPTVQVETLELKNIMNEIIPMFQ
jgi:hypothetical protein